MEIKFSTAQTLQQQLLQQLIATNFETSGHNPLLNPQIYQTTPEQCGIYLFDGAQMVGGLYYLCDHYQWLTVDLLWLDAAYRHQGWGTKLLDQVKQLAAERHLVGIKLETWDFQAKTFYEKNGFQVYGALDDHPRGVRLYHLFYRLNA